MSPSRVLDPNAALEQARRLIMGRELLHVAERYAAMLSEQTGPQVAIAGTCTRGHTILLSLVLPTYESCFRFTTSVQTLVFGDLRISIKGSSVGMLCQWS